MLEKNETEQVSSEAVCIRNLKHNEMYKCIMYEIHNERIMILKRQVLCGIF